MMAHTGDQTGPLQTAEPGESSVEEGLAEKALKRLMEQKKKQRSETEVTAVDSKRTRPPEVGDDSLTPSEIVQQGTFSPMELNGRRIIHPGSKDQKTLSAFQYMRRRVIEQLGGRKDGVVLVLSAVKNGGGTFTAINLATTLAFEKRVRCTIVECNPANSVAGSMLDVSPEYGWLDFIKDPSISGEDIIYPTRINKVSLMPVGGNHGSASDLITLGKLTTQFDVLRADSNHFIIIDGSSTDSSGDPRIFSDISDAIVLVVPYGRVTPDKLKDSLRGIDKDKIVGVLINKSPAVFS